MICYLVIKRLVLISMVVVLPLTKTLGETEVADFEGLLASPETHWSGPDPHGQIVDGEFGPEVVGAYVNQRVKFTNIYEQNAGSWRGFAYSNETDVVTTGFGNQFSAITGGGFGPAGGSFGIGFGHWDLEPNFVEVDAFDSTNPAHLNALPTLELAYGRTIDSVLITNTTYAALSMQIGDSFAKKFGGDSGSEPDWFKITAYGTDEVGTPLSIDVEFYLADFRFANSADDYIITDWELWDLSALTGARRLHFNLSSTDVGLFGMNTPAYFAIDNLAVELDLLPGDYNEDGNVDLADYTVWRNALGTIVDWQGSGADGNADGLIDDEDYALWRANLGRTLGTATVTGSSVPEPATWIYIIVSFLFWGRRQRSW